MINVDRYKRNKENILLSYKDIFELLDYSSRFQKLPAIIEQEVKNFISENSFEIFSNNKRQSEMAHIRNDACQISLHAMKMKQSFKDYRFCDVNIQIQKKENENNLPANLINPFNPGKQNLA